MDKAETTVAGKNCIIHCGSRRGTVLIQPVMKQELQSFDEEVSAITDAVCDEFMIAAFAIDDWNAQLSPWKAKAVFKDNDFAGRADDTLMYVMKELIPYINYEYALGPDVKYVIGGYSLAGLFSLYCAYRSDHFAAVAAASPSVWFPGWIEFARENSMLTKAVYLSLGEKEEFTKNQTMSAVGDNIREMADICAHTAGISAVKLEWNEGNHFTDPMKRTARGFAWAVRHLS